MIYRNIRNLTTYERLHLEKPENIKHKIMVIPDFHLVVRNPDNRFNYIEESLSYLDKIIQLIQDQKITTLIFLGDIFDRGFRVVKMDYLNKLETKFKSIETLCKIYTLVGNHEITYARDNPFYRMVELTGEAKSLTATIQKPDEILNIIQAVDYVDFDNTVRFVFNHFSKYPTKSKFIDENKINIGLFHHDLVSFESKMELYHHKIGEGINLMNTDILEGYKCIINGHIHTPINDMCIKDVDFINTGSIMRRTSKEIHDFVELPIISITEEECIIDKTTFELIPMEESFIMDIVDEERESRTLKKTLKSYSLHTMAEDFEDFVDKIDNEFIKFVLLNSDKDFSLNSTKEYIKLYNIKETDINER